VRTTIELDDDLLQVVRQLAKQRGLTIGKTISQLMRQALQPPATLHVRNGVPLFTPRKGAKKPDRGLVNRLRDAK